MKLVTVATHSQSYFPFLLESCKRYGAELVVLGFNQPWRGYNQKNILMKDYLGTQASDEIVCFIDAYDVLLLRPLEDLEAFFVNFNKITGARIIVGCDQTATGNIGLISRLYFGACDNKYVNSGTYIGYAADLLDMMTFIFKEISDDVQSDDQIMIRKYCSATKSVHIDCDRIFFFTLVQGKFTHFPLKHNEVNIVIDPVSHELRFNNIKPFLVHGAGNINMLNLVEALGYDISLEQRVTILQETDAWLQERTKHGYFQYRRMILVAISAIILFILLVAINMIASKHT
jgi:hypothetical protein